MQNRLLWSVLILWVVAHGAVPCMAREPWHGLVIKVHDGDSLVVRKGGREYEIRLYGIDTPEFGQPVYTQAREWTERRT